MAREFSAESLIPLPKLSIDAGLALLQALRAGVEAEKKLPAFLQPAWQNVADTGAALFQAAQARLAGGGNRLPTASKRKADALVDNAMGALEQFLQAWARLPDTLPAAQLAAATHQTLFPDGTSFLKLPFSEERMRSSVRAVQSFRGGRKCLRITDFGAERLITMASE